MSQLKLQAGMVEFFLSQRFNSIQGLSGLDDAHPRWGGQTDLLSPLIQMLFSSKNALPNILRNNIYPNIGHPLIY